MSSLSVSKMSASCLTQQANGGLKNRITNGLREEEEEEEEERQQQHEKYSRDSHLEVTCNIDTGKLNYNFVIFVTSTAL